MSFWTVFWADGAFAAVDLVLLFAGVFAVRLWQARKARSERALEGRDGDPYCRHCARCERALMPAARALGRKCMRGPDVCSHCADAMHGDFHIPPERSV